MRRTVYICTLFALPSFVLSSLPFGIECPKFLGDILPPSMHCSLCSSTAKLDGTVSDCACDYDTVNIATVSYFHPLLEKLQQTSFFRHFKVHLDTKCKFWDDGGHMCFAEGCMVKTCESDEIPAPWREDDQEDDSGTAFSSIEDQDENPFGCEQDFLKNIHEVLRDTGDDLGVWTESEDDRDVWIEQDENADMVYVDLLKNPEKFTGYVGQSTWKIWKAIYEENCFEESGQCIEKRVFYKLISGLQASISTHVASTFYYPPTKPGGEGHWGPNTQMFVEKVGKFPDRLEALYFTYIFLMRAVAKASSELESFDYSTGNLDDALTPSLVRAIVRPDHPLLSAASDAQQCQKGFDETRLFLSEKDNQNDANIQAAAKRTLSMDGSYEKFDEFMAASQHLKDAYGRDQLIGEGDSLQNADTTLKLAATEESVLLRSDFQSRFRNISRIMDCVGCEKCRLWGKLQILGIGTALKILLSPDDLADNIASEKRGYSLQRNEIIALLNTLAQFSSSVNAVNEWKQKEAHTQLVYFALMSAFACFSVITMLIKCFRVIATKKPKSS